MTTTQTIPLDQLYASKANVRRTGRNEGIGELAASIAAHGLRQNLNVQATEDSERFEVVAGGRRLRALKLLLKQGKVAGDYPVSCLVIEPSDNAGEISLVENTLRCAMHPDDQCEAFRGLIEHDGVALEDVAARFGVTAAVVRQRLKLAAVSPKLRALFRKGEMGLDHVMAFAISDDHAAQEAAWENLPDWNRDPCSIRAALTADSLPLTDRLAQFVGVETYVAAGGTILRDLFGTEGAGYLSDRALVMQLVNSRLEQEAETLQAEGWRWVKAELVRDYSIAYDRLPPGKASAKNKARAGVILRIGQDGALQIERGLIDPKDAKAEAKEAKGEASEVTPASGYSAALVADLTAHRTAALRIELARNPAVALAVTVHGFACRLLYPGQGSCLALTARSETLDRFVAAAEDSPAHKAMWEAGERWGDRLPGEGADLMAWCLAQPQDVLLDLLAYLAGLTVDAVQQRQGRADHADELAHAVKLDMTQWWTPSVEGFHGRMPKAALIKAVIEAKVTAPAPFDSVKKAEAAQMAAKALTGSGWLPEPLRMA